MGCTLRQYGQSRKTVDLSGLLLIVKLSIKSIRVCTYIAPQEFQGAKTNGVTAAVMNAISASGVGTIASTAGGNNRRKSTSSQYAPESRDSKKRIPEAIIEDDDARQDGSNSYTGNVHDNASACGEDNASVHSAYTGYRGSNRKIAWSTTDLMPKDSEISNAVSAPQPSNHSVTSAQKAKSVEDSKEDIVMCVLDSGNGSEKFLNLCIIIDFPEKAQGVSVEAVDVQCALGPLDLNIGNKCLNF